MDRLEAISVNLTVEEMVVLLDQLGADNYAGLDTSSVENLSERERNLVLDVAWRGLAARQILSKDEAGKWQVSQFAMAALGISLSPAKSVMIFRGENRDTAVSHLYHTAQDVFISHEVIDDGIHQFLLVRDGQTWQESILSASGLSQDENQESLNVPPALIRPLQLNHAYDLAQAGDVAQAEVELIQAGIAKPTAQSLVMTLTKQVVFATIIGVTHSAVAEQRELTFLSSANECWRLETQNGSGEANLLGIRPISVKDARQQVLAMLA